VGGRRKASFAAVLRLLREEDPETFSRDLDLSAATLSGWRVQVLEGDIILNAGWNEYTSAFWELDW